MTAGYNTLCRFCNVLFSVFPFFFFNFFIIIIIIFRDRTRENNFKLKEVSFRLDIGKKFFYDRSSEV